MSELLKFKGRLLEKELEIKALKVGIDGLRDSLRDHLDPFAEPEDLKAEIIVQQAFELGKKIAAYRKAVGEAEALKKALGR